VCRSFFAFLQRCPLHNNIVPTSHPGQALWSVDFASGVASPFTAGGGFEIAATSFHPTNHIPILSIRFPF
jgi:hypothetical protein